MIFEAMGKSFTLRYDFNAICEIEAKAGKGFDELLSQQSGVHLSTRYLLWGGLLKNHKSITLDETGAIIENLIENGKSLVDIIQIIFNELVSSGFIGKKIDNNNENNIGNAPSGEPNPEKI